MKRVGLPLSGLSLTKESLWQSAQGEVPPVMIARASTSGPAIWVAVEVAKTHHDVLIESHQGRRWRFRMANSRQDFVKFAAFLSNRGISCSIALEAKGDYYRPLAQFLRERGFAPRLVSSTELTRTRGALHDPRDKTSSKIAQVILHLLKTGDTQLYNEPPESHLQDMRELANTYHRISLWKARLHRTIVTHFLPLYFPEAARYLRGRRADWFLQILLLTPCPAAVSKYSAEEFLKAALVLKGSRHTETRWLADFYEAARDSIGLSVGETSDAIQMFRMTLNEYMDLCRVRQELENHIRAGFSNDSSFQRLQAVPGIGPIQAMTILAESGDLRLFSHSRRFLKYCGLEPLTEQSGLHRGPMRSSKGGNTRLHNAFMVAGAAVVRARRKSLGKKPANWSGRDSTNPQLRREAQRMAAAEVARMAYKVVKGSMDPHLSVARQEVR